MISRLFSPRRRGSGLVAALLAISPLAGVPLVGDGVTFADAQNCGRTTTGMVPLNDLGELSHKGAVGGLYGNGLNHRPGAHDQAGRAEAQRVVPRDAQGNPATNGRIVLLSIGMSNTTQEYREFIRAANADPAVNPSVQIVDGAMGGQAAGNIANPSAPYWAAVDQRLQQQRVTPAQVQVVWLKEAMRGPTAAFPVHAQTLQGYLDTIAGILRSRFPNCRLCYCSSRIYAGYATTALNPEPFAYESAFSVKWLIGDQVAGKPSLNYDPTNGPVRAPWLSWGPYLWADGISPRSDGLVWNCTDFANDGTHPATSGRLKVAQLLLEHFKTDATTKPWFLANSPPPCIVQAIAVRYGTGFGGPNGITQISSMQPTLPTVRTFRLQAHGGPKNAAGMFLVGLRPLPDNAVPAFGGSILVAIGFGVPANTDRFGKATVTFFPLPANPSWCGLQFYFQYGVQDVDSPQGYDLTRGLRVRLGG